VTNLATMALLLLIPMLPCGGLTVWRGYVCEPNPRRAASVPFVAFCVFLLSVFMFFAAVFLVLVELATGGPDEFITTSATVAATAVTSGAGVLLSSWAKTRRSELQLLARFDADGWWKERDHELPERVREAVAKLAPAPYPELTTLPPASTKALYRAAWARAFILDEFTHRERVGRL